MGYNKAIKTRCFTLELPAHTWEWLGKRADENGITVDACVAEILMEKITRERIDAACSEAVDDLNFGMDEIMCDCDITEEDLKP